MVFDDKPFEDGCLYGKQLKCYDNQRIPVIHMPVYTNMLSFTKQLSVVLATYFENERYVENWLREICYSGNEVLEQLADQVLDPLFEHQDLLQLLAVYYTYGEDLKATVERLFIHVNTVKYRLKKVDEILGYNSRESNARFRLQLAIIAYQHLQQSECKV